MISVPSIGGKSREVEAAFIRFMKSEMSPAVLTEANYPKFLRIKKSVERNMHYLNRSTGEISLDPEKVGEWHNNGYRVECWRNGQIIDANYLIGVSLYRAARQ